MTDTRPPEAETAAPAQDKVSGATLGRQPLLLRPSLWGRYAVAIVSVVAMTLPIARELAQFGVRVNAIAPGIFLTPMLLGLPQEAQDSLGRSVPGPARLGKPEEYAALAVHIIENGYINGETIRIDGALRMAPR